MRVAALAVACLLLVAGCAAPLGSAPPDTPPDRDEDPVGWERGHWYDDGVVVDANDGMNQTERRVVTVRAMARVERIRDLEFERSVTVEVISREQFNDRGGVGGGYTSWDDQVWEATFLVGEDTTAGDAFGEVYGGSVVGYYVDDSIVLVAEDPDEVSLDRATLVHELTHALQDQQLALGTATDSHDAGLAANGLVEGDANYVMDRYAERCGDEWDCVGGERASTERSYNMGLFLAVYFPYSDGPEFVGHLRDRGGWESVDDAYDDFPESSEQIIHPERYPNETPADVTVADRSSGEWERFGDGTETVGEATLYATFWQNNVISEDHLYSDERRYNYSHPITDGWAGDTLVPYRNGDEFGYVFRTQWDSDADAREFHEAYLELLDERGAERVAPNTYRVPERDSFGDAFRVVREGRTVRIVNAPTVDDLADVHESRF
jgi:hypothetical protein